MLSQCLGMEFKIKTLARLKYLLGIKLVHSKKGIYISQLKYITNLFKERGKTVCRLVSTPIDPNIKLGSAKEAFVVDKEMSQKTRGQAYLLISH